MLISDGLTLSVLQRSYGRYFFNSSEWCSITMILDLKASGVRWQMLEQPGLMYLGFERARDERAGGEACW